MGYTIDDNYIKALREALPKEQLLTDEPMARHTTFLIGGKADVFVLPASIEELLEVLKLTKRYSVPLTVLGNGSNVLVRDGGIRGAVVSFGKPFSHIEREGTRILAGAGATLGTVSLFAASHALSGLEFAVGIPGSLGGAVFMNAGAYDGEMKDAVVSVEVMTRDGKVKILGREDLQFAYRHSALQAADVIVLTVKLQVKEGDTASIQAKMDDFSQRRISKQPLDMPSAGSTFKRPEGHFVGQMVEESGLKGFRIGGAEVSVKHAGFIVNANNASAADVLQLIEYIKIRILKNYNVALVPEILVLGEE